MSSRTTGHTTDANFIVESILSGAAPWLQLSSETTLEYAFFGGHSPFANWVGDDWRQWEDWPTSESLFLTNELGRRIRSWVRDFDRCAYPGEHGLPETDASEFAQVALDGLKLVELIRDEIPYYFVEATFLDSVPRAVIDCIDHEAPDQRGYRKLDGTSELVDRRHMTFRPFDSRKAPPERSKMSTAIKADLGRYGGSVREPHEEFWAKLDAWQAQWEENFVGLPKFRGGTPQWRPGFDRLGWITQGLELQHESRSAIQGTRLSCGAAHLAISKDEWDSLLDEYLANHLEKPSGH
ncbi:hypothetical protein [Dietzia sp. PP-33]|jgi:hypothetical protein|uniref:hypothetical protein n=1 Tax=Dietzia sp. PP-33 TaxID=2957500 RepID=UPI0029B3BA51|nr:hypothetical protein [Dietzia sp. PP-33]MDX2358363.1 hypothetical protein [Dietzia sp. PP-33]